ncbi:pyridoxal phosphate-dependent aminotransferase [Paralimibaculum aggregatum]|uniref:aspartate transaminase n=1 Tax=Paralimibaculum aggregatum TaxID=3036245 RepID=A0ABQ6LNE3_9RHOB|nr:pyridoxal phosphate-dependent aminotransferase [Limibaculum sp. NKW23]GMG84721.1 pyridoxal phosphate-dependent aminotransferase [Limibaculum sp. NKW23]
MRLSSRIQHVVPGGDDGWEIYYRARAMAEAGETVTMLSIGDHDIGPDAGIVAALTRSLAAGHTGYTPVEGTGELRAAIAATRPEPTAPEQVAVTCGGQAGLFAAMMAVLDPGESCVVLDPYYATYAQTVRAAGGVPIIVPCRAADGFQPDAGAIRAALRPDTRAVLLNTPNNPSGAVYDAERIAALVALAEERGLWLISDEVYASQVWAGSHRSPRALPAGEPRTLVVGSMSKSHGMTGFRTGWVIGPRAAVDRICELGVTTTYGLPGFIQDAAAHALRHGEAAAAEIRARYGARRAAALAALGSGPGFRVVPPAGGMYLLLDIRETGLTGDAFAARLLERCRIAVMPGESFGAAAAGHVRIALTVAEPLLLPALREIAAMAAGLAMPAAAGSSAG